MATSFPLPNSGATLPSVSFGLGTTLKNQHDPVVRAVLEAWEAGYRSFDGARQGMEGGSMPKYRIAILFRWVCHLRHADSL